MGWKPVVQEPGVYQMPNGSIYVVKENRDHTRLYAKRLVETVSQRVTEAGAHVDFDFQYEPGAIYDLLPEYKMSFEKAKPLMIKYGRCIACGRHLKVAQSVERGVGPVCIRYFRQDDPVLDLDELELEPEAVISVRNGKARLVAIQ